MTMTNTERQRRWRERHRGQPRMSAAARRQIDDLEARLADVTRNETPAPPAAEQKQWPVVRLDHELSEGDEDWPTGLEWDAAWYVQEYVGDTSGRAHEAKRKTVARLTEFAEMIEHFGPELAKAARRHADHVSARPPPERRPRRKKAV